MGTINLDLLGWWLAIAASCIGAAAWAAAFWLWVWEQNPPIWVDQSSGITEPLA